MPALSAGGMRFQHKWQDRPFWTIPSAAQKNLESCVRRALEHGIVHIETARHYGTSERQLGRILPLVERDSLIVQTKIAPHEDAQVFVKNFHESLARLRLDHVDLLALHGVNDRKLLEWSLRPGGCFEAAQRLREAGKARFIGFSTHAPLPVILEALRFGEARVGAGFDYVNLHYYFIMQRNWPAIVEATLRDMGVFIISPSDKGGKLYAPPQKLVELCAPLSPMAFNDLFCLSHPEVHTLSVGASRASDFDEHVAAVELTSRASELLPAIVERLRSAMLEATGAADPEAILHGVPEWQDAPGQLNLQTMLWLRNLARGWDLLEYGKMRFNMMGGADHWFPGAKPSGLRDIEPRVIAQAVSGSSQAEQIPALLRESLDLLGGAPVQRLSKS
ncbi:MAG TPA: aldo/keto reductase [Polyangiaceae bacterium]|nr:aldo/keto reductase [Polyangiaceae bacterium]